MPVPATTLSPTSGPVNSAIPVVATGYETFWTGSTAFYVSGPGSPLILGLSVINNRQAVFTLETGSVAGPLTISNNTDSSTAVFTVVGGTAQGDETLHFTYDPTTPIGQLRFKISDIDVSRAGQSLPRSQWSCLFADEELQLFLNDWAGDIDRAAIMAIRFIAARPQMQVHALRMLNLEMDIGDMAASLNHLADELQRARTEFPYSELAEQGNTDFDYRRILWNRIQRQGGTSP